MYMAPTCCRRAAFGNHAKPDCLSSTEVPFPNTRHLRRSARDCWCGPGQCVEARSRDVQVQVRSGRGGCRTSRASPGERDPGRGPRSGRGLGWRADPATARPDMRSKSDRVRIQLRPSRHVVTPVVTMLTETYLSHSCPSLRQTPGEYIYISGQTSKHVDTPASVTIW
jgi:hypothetical protein